MPKFLELDYTEEHPDLKSAKEENPSFDLFGHFKEFGRHEGRHLKEDVKGHIDNAFITNSGYVFLNGWLLDPYRRERWHENPDFRFSLRVGYYAIEIPSSSVIRYRRDDIIQTFGTHGDFDFGFLIFAKLSDSMPIANKLALCVETKGNAVAARLDCEPQICSETKIISRYFLAFRHLLETNIGLAACLNGYDRHHPHVLGCWREHLKHASK